MFHFNPCDLKIQSIFLITGISVLHLTPFALYRLKDYMTPAAISCDVRHSLRILLKYKGFAFAVIFSLALGIGANTAIFSVVNSVLLRPLAYKDPDSLIVTQVNGSTTTSPADFLDWKANSRSFEQLAAAQYWGANITGAEKPEWVLGLQVSANMFDLLGVAPLRGRTFLAGDERPGNDPVLVISHRLWTQRFGADPGVIGRVLTLDGKAYTVTGIMPERFAFAPFWATKAEMWTPLMLAERKYDRDGRSLRVFGRLKNGVDLRSARAEMDTISRRLAQQYPKTNAKFFPTVTPLHEMVVGNIRPTLLVLLGTVGFVLLIACANVANLMLARVTAKRREIAVRLALGANRAQLIAQLLTESMLLSLIGGVFGIMIAYWGVNFLSAMLPAGSLPRQRELRIDSVALAFTLFASVVTGLVAGLIPGWQASKGDVNDALKEGGRGASEGPGRHRTRGLLVASEIALSFVLLIGAGLMIRSFLNIQATNPGFNPRNVLSMVVSVAGTGQLNETHRAAFYHQVVQELEAMPGVKSVSAINHLPVGGDLWTRGLAIAGRPVPRPGEELDAVYRVANPGYFRTMELPLVQGREFTSQDRLGAPGVIIVNESMAKSNWPGESPIGKRVTLDDPQANPEWLTVVGVAKDAKQSDWTQPIFDEMYLPFLQSKPHLSNPAGHFAYMTFVIRTAGNPIGLAAAARSAVWRVDSSVRISDLASMEQFVADKLWRQRVSLLLLGIFAAVALILAVTGIYGVVSHSVAQRTHEIGVRVALGATKSDVIGLSLREGMWPVFSGVVCGALIALAVSKLMASLLYQVTPLDPVTFAGVAVSMLMVALIANYVPARRAISIDPMSALRHD
jgi:putative ABC transport system permease protein